MFRSTTKRKGKIQKGISSHFSPPFSVLRKNSGERKKRGKHFWSNSQNRGKFRLFRPFPRNFTYARAIREMPSGPSGISHQSLPLELSFSLFRSCVFNPFFSMNQPEKALVLPLSLSFFVRLSLSLDKCPCPHVKAFVCYTKRECKRIIINRIGEDSYKNDGFPGFPGFPSYLKRVTFFAREI